MEYFIQDPCFCSKVPAGNGGLCCHQRLWIIDKSKVDLKKEPKFLPCCLSLHLSSHSNPSIQNKPLMIQYISTGHHDTGIFSACFPLKIQGRKMCFEAPSFYLLEMVSEKITKLSQKREVAWLMQPWLNFFHSLSLQQVMQHIRSER